MLCSETGICDEGTKDNPMAKNEQNSGSIRTLRGGARFQALLPRELSRPAPKNCKNPDAYQRPVGTFTSWDEARRVLDAAVLEQGDTTALRNGLPFSNYVQQEIRGRFTEAKRTYGSINRANKAVSTWKSIDEVHLQSAPFYQDPPGRIEIPVLQNWFDWLKDEAESQTTGEPLSGSFIGNVGRLVAAAFKRAKVLPNPVDSLELPSKGKPRIVYMTLPEQRKFFGSREIELMDRILAGCGMGSGLRIGELLALEVTELHLDADDPHLWVLYGGDGHAPPKGREERRVELFEPGLGFFRLWMRGFYRPENGPQIFAGPKGGYRKAWPEKFAEEGEAGAPSWREVVGGKLITSHVMRHSYAVAMLSGTWGYDPQSLQFIQDQLGHADITTTERYYGKYEDGTWQRQVRHFTGRQARPESPEALTARQLLCLSGTDEVAEARSEARTPKNLDKTPQKYLSPSLTQIGTNPERNAPTEAHVPQALGGLAVEVLQAVEAGDPLAHTKAVELARAVLAHLAERDGLLAEVAS